MEFDKFKKDFSKDVIEILKLATGPTIAIKKW